MCYVKTNIYLKHVIYYLCLKVKKGIYLVKCEIFAHAPIVKSTQKLNNPFLFPFGHRFC